MHSIFFLSLFLEVSSLNFSLAPNIGYYSPSLEKLNDYLYRYKHREVNPGILYGGELRLEFKMFSIGAEGNYFAGSSSDKFSSLSLVPIGGDIRYKLEALPALLTVYASIGYEWCYVKYSEEDNLSADGWGKATKASLGLDFEFVPKTAFSIYIGGKYGDAWRIKTSENEDFKDALSSPPAIIPIELTGIYVGIAFRYYLLTTSKK